MSADPLAPIEGARQAALARVHPVAALFPMLDAVALRELADDIAKHGLLEPIVILDGVLLDGRNREAACELAGVDPIYREWMGDESEITAWILSKNIHRRHLDASQRAMVAGRLAELGQGQRVIAAAVETGKSAGLKTGERQFPAAPTQAEAARLLNVGERTVREARAVVTDGASELAAAVDRGEVAVSTAAALTRRVPDKETQRQIVTELGEEGVRVFAAPPSPSPAAHPGEEERPTVQAPGTAEAGASSSGATGGVLRLRNAGRRVLDELRARGLRPDSCSTAGCQLPAGHPRDHVLFASRYAAKPARPAPAQPRRIFGEDVNGTAPLEVAVVLSGIGQRPITITLLPERVRSVNVICFSRAQAALLADELRVRLAEAGP